MPKIQATGQTQTKTPRNLQGNKTIRERLVERWKPSEFVRVINIDDEPYHWQWFPSTAEEANFSSDGLHRQVSGRDTFDAEHKYITPGNQEDWFINPGESEVLLGENAYLMVEGLYKKLITKGKLANVDVTEPGRKPINFNFSDGKMQEDMIDKIFLGIVNPNFNEPVTTTKARN